MNTKSRDKNNSSCVIARGLLYALIVLLFLLLAVDFVVQAHPRVVILPTSLHFIERILTSESISSLIFFQNILSPILIIVVLSLVAFVLSHREWTRDLFKFSDKKNRPPISFLFLIFFLILVFILQVFSGVWVTTFNAGLACPDWPLCKGELIPSVFGNVGLQVLHRFLGYFFSISVIALANACRRLRVQKWMSSRMIRLSYLLVTLLIVQIVTGIMSVFFGLPIFLSLIHILAVYLMALVFVFLLIEIFKSF